MNAIQLSLFPRRGFGLINNITGDIVEDWRTGEPLIKRTRPQLRPAAKSLSWGNPRIVWLERHDDSDEGGRATYVVVELR